MKKIIIFGATSSIAKNFASDANVKKKFNNLLFKKKNAVLFGYCNQYTCLPDYCHWLYI